MRERGRGLDRDDLLRGDDVLLRRGDHKNPPHAFFGVVGGFHCDRIECCDGISFDGLERER